MNKQKAQQTNNVFHSSISHLRIWGVAIRPKTLPAAAAPVLVGFGVAFLYGDIQILPALVTLFTSILLQILANLVNDVADYERGADTADRLGPQRVTQAGLLSPKQVWTGVWLTVILSILCGLYLVYVSGWPILLIGVLSILAALAYSIGPYPLSYIGLGDLFVIIFFGFVAVNGTVFIVSGEVPFMAWIAAIPVAALTTNILVVNNIRDIEADRRAGRKNIPVIYGRKGGEIEYAFMLVIAYGSPWIMVLFNAPATVFLPWLTFPFAYKLFRSICTNSIGPSFNNNLAKSAQLLLFFSLLLTTGFAMGRLI